MSETPHLSIVVPLFNEEGSVRPLADAVTAGLNDGSSWELILVDDGSTDQTARVAAEIARASPPVRLLRLARNYGQTAAMQAGFDYARGSVVVSMDGDLQNDPRDVPRLVAKLSEGYDLVVGYRHRRQDGLLNRRIPSWAANLIVRWITGVPIHDNGCSLKAYRRELLERMRLYAELHRFIPAVAAGVTGARIAEVVVRHHPRRYGKSKYGISRVMKVASDLVVVTMIRFFRSRPLAMFASGAVAAGLCGLAFSTAAGISMVFFRPEKASALVLPGAALLWFGLACYLFMLGLLGEVAVRRGRESPAALYPVNDEEAQ
jgi:glycosyltransferase involved in cell wall biosynthesis